MNVEKTTATIANNLYPILIATIDKKTSIDGKKFVIVFENQKYEQQYSECNLTISGCHWDDQGNMTTISGGIDPKGCYFKVPENKGAFGIRIILPMHFKLDQMKIAVYEVSEHNFLMTRELRKKLNQNNIETTHISVYDTHWRDKNVISFGTSITRKRSSTSVNVEKYLANSYADYLAQLLAFNLNNQGVGSSGITVTASGKDNLLRIQQFVASEDKDNYDLITLEVGANDVSYVWNGKGGDPTDLYDPDTGSQNTFCGRLNYCLNVLQKNTRAQIVVIPSPYSQSEFDSGETVPTTWTSWDLIKWIYKTNKLTKECCDFNSVPCLIIDHNLGFARLDSDTTNEYVKEDLKSSPDIHPTELGAQIIAENLSRKIKDIPLFYHE